VSATICERKFEGLPCDCEQCQAEKFEEALTQPPPTPKAIVTDAMLDAGLVAAGSARYWVSEERLTAIYTAMHAASPNPEASEIMREAWQPIETAPKDGSSILAIWRWGDNPDNGAETHMVVRWCGWWDAQGFTQPEPTHWMPLPEPPSLSSICKGEQ
jgi:hypothetical protein